MKLESVSIQNFGPFRRFSADLGALAGPLVALVGPNGAGKSTFAELALPGTMYRDTPTRGTLVELATSREAVLETRLVNGSTWTIRHLVDKLSGKSEVTVIGSDGKPALPDTKVRSFDAWAEKHLPAPEVLFSCMFAPQGSGGFLAAKPAERKSILLRILGIERLEAQADLARERARTTRAKHEVLVARVTDERARGGDVDATAADHARAVAEVERLDAELAERRRLLADLTQKAREADEARRVAGERATLRQRLFAEQGSATFRIGDFEKRLRNNRAVIEDAPAIRLAVAEVEKLRAAITEYTSGADHANGLAREAAQKVVSSDQRLKGIATRIERARKALEGRSAVESAVASIATLEAEAAQASADHRAAEDALDALQGERAVGAEARIDFLRTGLRGVVREPEHGAWYAKEALEVDDAAVASAAALPDRLREAQAGARAAFQRAESAARRVAEAKATAARSEALGAAERDLAEAEAEHQTVMAERAEAEAGRDESLTIAGRFRDRVQAATPALEAAQKVAAKAEPLAHAEARIAELEPQLEAAKADLERVNAELEANPELEAPPAVSLETGEHLVRETEVLARRAADDVAVAASKHAQAVEAKERLDALVAECSSVELELADWNRLAKDFGKDGLQAAEIDAAGPELTALVNTLLHEAHGARFTVRVDTQKLAADGKRLLEGCEVVVLDTENGREAAGQTFSGGEKVIIGEAMSLALTMLACRRAGVTGATLIRDETGAALDPSNARVYVTMLRRAAELVRADKILFVSHVPELIELADARIEVGS